MRTLQGQSLHNTNGLFKNETQPNSNDGTELVAENPLTDLYYASLNLLEVCGEKPSEEREEIDGKSQIVDALDSRYANKEATEEDIKTINSKIKDNFSDTDLENSNVNLQTKINNLNYDISIIEGAINDLRRADSAILIKRRIVYGRVFATPSTPEYVISDSVWLPEHCNIVALSGSFFPESSSITTKHQSPTNIKLDRVNREEYILSASINISTVTYANIYIIIDYTEPNW